MTYGQYFRNPLARTRAITSDRVLHATGIQWWPKGLNWYITQRPQSRYLSIGFPASKCIATYTIKSKGRTGAKDRQRLMTHKRFAVAVQS